MFTADYESRKRRAQSPLEIRWWKSENTLENPGIDPGASRMQIERSTTWANPPAMYMEKLIEQCCPVKKCLKLFVLCFSPSVSSMIDGMIAFNNCFASITLALTIYLVHGNLRDILPLQRQRLSSSEALPERDYREMFLKHFVNNPNIVIVMILRWHHETERIWRHDVYNVRGHLSLTI